MLLSLLSSPVRWCGVLVSFWAALLFCAPVSPSSFHFKLGELEEQVSVLGWLVKGNVALPRPRDPLSVRCPRGGSRALRALITSWRVPFLSLRGSCFISEGRWQFPTSIPPSSTVIYCSIHQRSSSPHCSAKILADYKAELGWVHRWPLILNEHLLCQST